MKGISEIKSFKELQKNYSLFEIIGTIEEYVILKNNMEKLQKLNELYIEHIENMKYDFFNYLNNNNEHWEHLKNDIFNFLNKKDDNIYNEKPEIYNEKVGFVYILKDFSQNDVFKVGRTKDLTRREKEFIIGNCYCKIIASVKTTYEKSVKLEDMIHKRLSNNNISGEWFQLDEYELNLLIDFYGFKRHISA